MPAIVVTTATSSSEAQSSCSMLAMLRNRLQPCPTSPNPPSTPSVPSQAASSVTSCQWSNPNPSSVAANAQPRQPAFPFQRPPPGYNHRPAFTHITRPGPLGHVAPNSLKTPTPAPGSLQSRKTLFPDRQHRFQTLPHRCKSSGPCNSGSIPSCSSRTLSTGGHRLRPGVYQRL
jgi:hypothetical protein